MTGILFLIIVFMMVYLVAPRMFGRPDCTALVAQRFYAHRGLFDNESDAPENSMKAFQRAVMAGYGIEMDVQLTKDEQLIVFHDATLKRMCGVDGAVGDYTWEELSKMQLKGSAEKIPLFAEVLRMVDGKVPLIVEYKMYRPGTKVCELGNNLLSRYEGVYCIESFHPRALMWYRKHCPKVVRGQLSGNLAATTKDWKKKILYTFGTYLLNNVFTRPDFVAYDERYVHNFSRKLCNSLGAISVAYTIRNVQRYEEVKSEFDLFIFDSCTLN